MSILFRASAEDPPNTEAQIKKAAPPGGLEPPTFRLTAERASRLRHRDILSSLELNDRFKSVTFEQVVLLIAVL